VRRRPSWPVLILSGALVLVILLLGGTGVWVRDRIEALEAEAAALRTAVERRDGVIDLQRARLDDVRGGVHDVRGQLDDVRGRLESLDALLGKPLPEAD
jgi:hypothetical protein